MSSRFDDGGNARGRRVGIAVAGDGAMRVAHDVGNVVWRVTPIAAAAAPVAAPVPPGKPASASGTPG